MIAHIVASALVCVLPVLAFLGVLLYLDSYKLVRLRDVMGVLFAGAIAASVGYAIDGALQRLLVPDFDTLTRYVAPVTEELLKALVVLALLQFRSIGFLVDAAIFGFATGAGFATVENLYYLDHARDAGLGTWIVRGFGTSLMHGGSTAMFAVLGLAMLEEKRTRSRLLAFAPGWLLAIAVHSGYNHLYLSPRASTVAVLVVLPPLFYAVFQRSERSLADWLGRGFDADAEMLALLDSGRFSDSPTGRYLQTLKRKFSGPVVADALCYLRLHTELALRAKGILMMRENGFEVPLDDETRAKFDEMRYLERSIGRTGLRALRPVLHTSHKEEWQLRMLGR